MIKVDVWLKLIDELVWQHIHTNYNISTLKKLTYPHSFEHIHTLAKHIHTLFNISTLLTLTLESLRDWKEEKKDKDELDKSEDAEEAIRCFVCESLPCTCVLDADGIPQMELPPDFDWIISLCHETCMKPIFTYDYYLWLITPLLGHKIL